MPVCLDAFIDAGLCLRNRRQQMANRRNRILRSSRWDGRERHLLERSFYRSDERLEHQTSFNFILREQYRDPCLSDGLNSVDFSDSFCGSEFGKNTLAVTVQSFKSAILGGPTIAESDIIIDQNK